MQNKGFSQVFTLFNTHTPQVYADIDRTKAELLGVPIGRVFEALSVYMGSSYVNDFNILGRTYQVTAQADNAYRLTLRDVANLKTRNATGDMVPIGSAATFNAIEPMSPAMRRTLDNATQAELLRFKAADAVSTQGAGKITIYEKNGEHRASFDITGSYVLTLRQPPKDASHGKRPRW